MRPVLYHKCFLQLASGYITGIRFGQVHLRDTLDHWFSLYPSVFLRGIVSFSFLMCFFMRSVDNSLNVIKADYKYGANVSPCKSEIVNSVSIKVKLCEKYYINIYIREKS